MSNEIWQLDHGLERKKEEKETLKASGLGQRSGNAGPVASCSVLGQLLSRGVSPEPRTPRKKGKWKPKRHFGLLSEGRWEYYKS